VSAAASAISSMEYEPLPTIMGIGPIRITAPVFALPRFEIDPSVSRRMPMKIAANAIRNRRLASPN